MMDSHQVFEGHGGRIFSIALCVLPDGRRVAASASHDRTVRIWSLNDHTLLQTIEYSDFVWRVFLVVDPKPLVIAFISTENKIQISDLLTGQTERLLDGRLIFAGSLPLFRVPVVITAQGEEDICFIDVLSGHALLTICGGFEKAFRAVVASAPQPKLVFTTWNAQNRRSTIQTYDLAKAVKAAERSDEQVVVVAGERGSMRLVFEGDSRDGVTSVVITLHAKPLICSGHYDAIVRLWDLDSLVCLMQLEGHEDYVGSVAVWRGEDPVVVSASTDGTLRAWDSQTGALIAVGKGHNRDVWAVAVSHSPRPIIVSGSFDRSVRLWDLQPLLAERKWTRRKAFCVAIHALLHGLLEGDALQGTASAVVSVLQVQSLCAAIASFL